MDNGKGLKLMKALNRYKVVLIAAAAGIVLLTWPEGESTVAPVVQAQISDGERAIRKLEEEMESILSKMYGVGRVDVMLTLQSGTELVLASDTTLRYSGSPHNPDDYERSSDTLTVSGGSGDDVVVTQEKSPQYRGALVVCDGGDNDAVRLRVVEAVAALTGLGSDRIAVVRWGSSSAETMSGGEELS